MRGKKREVDKTVGVLAVKHKTKLDEFRDFYYRDWGSGFILPQYFNTIVFVFIKTCL